ncbi:MAG: diguanylate phosphodiesterase [Candidatus Sedimenticola endophacoides]|uniref:Diguanylate phosphodiesterase n=1 Tax=Candidatus Sedimenticola endophacoides TaxID=2548426 RepID=A0A657Q1K8_9GAMM|nr:MAG: diguanylate phosphodiesterase [Candidatus Sedimenticola endophacoides]OQX43072.1 MAG: diguanylate phosphodiesterase [Candidatus Sedimenticola endophacoides]OQX45619.1 MAG: diguanylate phosphodiesterase [Candidatus Sedimenticola endophacoides]OQX47376.1 MAG: diguanylate phosphodiesterase [Candidatus Sedimenticola endophacoides]PUE03963.1 MAG: diguanylate phosphodiesterase [Candidatus Sedimenticola endophacoides]
MDLTNFSQTVLVVDDERFVLRTTEFVLRRLGFQYVQTADAVADAMQAVLSANPPVGLVLSDLNMPDADGLDLLRRFDEMGYRGDILLFSGEDGQTLTMAESLAKARGLSVIGTLPKPLQPDRLVQILAQRVGLNTQTGQARVKSAQAAVAVPAVMLERAIEAGELVPWFQPKIDIATLTPVAVEALARWPHSARGAIYPNDFIPVAEDHGLIDRLTFVLMAQAARIEAAWRRQGIELKVAFNVSMKSLHEHTFPDSLERALAETGGSLGRFQLEVTESQLMEDLVRPLEVLLRLRMKRVRLSIDDFGTGHSNLSQLRDLPFDELKLDRSYVHAASNGERTGVILESTVEMARKLGMTIVAEGVETLDEWMRVKQLGCDQVQGYFAARPMPGDQIPGWIASWPETRARLFGI